MAVVQGEFVETPILQHDCKNTSPDSTHAPLAMLVHGPYRVTMRACIQRVREAQVVVDAETVGQIGCGLVVLLGVAAEDEVDDAKAMADKIVGLRIFDDPDGKMNLALADVGGSMLVVSQFTLLGDCRKGRRPSFVAAAPPERAEQLYEFYCAEVRGRGIAVETGRFRQHMRVTLTNDGPVTLWLDTRAS